MPRIFLIGGTGFIGRAVLAEALCAGFEVHALARSDASASSLRAAGAHPVRGDANDSDWTEHARGTDALIDLLQPPLPTRMSRRAIRGVAGARTAATAKTLAALERVPDDERPLYVSISGADDLEPDATGTIGHGSRLRSGGTGFAMIGVPVTGLVERSPVQSLFVNFGVMVYGPGKGFADVYVKGLRQRRAAVIGSGSNRLPLTHVDDAAAGLVHLVGLPRDKLAGHRFLVADGADVTQRELLELTATLMGAKQPMAVPAAVARIVAGPVAVEAMTFDAHVDNSALLQTGFRFRYPSPREGLPSVLEKLGEYRPAGAPV